MEKKGKSMTDSRCVKLMEMPLKASQNLEKNKGYKPDHVERARIAAAHQKEIDLLKKELPRIYEYKSIRERVDMVDKAWIEFQKERENSHNNDTNSEFYKYTQMRRKEIYEELINTDTFDGKNLVGSSVNLLHQTVEHIHEL